MQQPTRSRVDVPWTIRAEGAILEIQEAVFSRNAILRAAYKYTDRAYVYVFHPEGRRDVFAVILTSRNEAADSTEVLLGEFMNELVDQQVREQLSAAYGSIRALIVAQALAEGNLLDPVRDQGDVNADPMGIGQQE